MKLSVILPIYNVEKYLDRCMNSLLNQTLKEIEIIMVDDESPDNCPNLCEQYAKQYANVKVVHKKNAGLGLARNTGLECATGEYVAFVDSDDFVDTEMYENLYHFAKLNSCDAVFCGYNIYKDESHIIKCQEQQDYVVFSGQKQVKGVLLDMVGSLPQYKSDVRLLMSVWRAIYSRKVILANKLNFVSERIYIAEDIMFHLDFLPCCDKIGFIPQAYYYYCYNGSSLTRNYKSDRFLKEIYLYHSIRNKMHDAGYQIIDYKNRLDRYLLMKVRACISQQVQYIDKLKYRRVRKNIKDIVNSHEVREVIDTYPRHFLPFKHHFFFLLIKYRLYDLFIILFKILK